MDEKQWHEWRNKGIGGSDCAAILGYSPYMTNVELWEDKVHGIKKEFKNTEVLERGHKVEPLIRELFAIDHPELIVTYKDNDHFTDPDYEFRRATVDGRIQRKSDGKMGILEIKHVQLGSSAQAQKWKGQVPMNYFCQCLHYLDCSRLDFAILKARFRREFSDGLFITEKEYFIDAVEHKDSIEYLRNAEVEFWNKYVVTGIKPPLVLPAI